jgi:hypothetical protein
MVVAVPNESDRDNLVAYFDNLSRTQSAAGAASHRAARLGSPVVHDQ